MRPVWLGLVSSSSALLLGCLVPNPHLVDDQSTGSETIADDSGSDGADDRGTESGSSSDTFGTEGGESETETDETGPDETDTDTETDTGDEIIDDGCDQQGRCWARRESWGAWAQRVHEEDLQMGIESGTLTWAGPLGFADCWWYAEGARTCVLEVEGIALTGRPLSEISVVDARNCLPDTPWESSFTSTFHCHGVFPEIGIALRAIE